MRLARPSSADGESELGEIVALHAPLDLQLDRVGELVAVRPEQLDAVVLIGIVRGRDHHPEIASHHARQHCDRRRRQRTQQHHVHAHRQEPGGERRLQHVAGKPRVLADDDAMPVIAAPEMRPRRKRQRQRRCGRDRLAIGPAPDSIRSEQLARHGEISRSPLWHIHCSGPYDGIATWRQETGENALCSRGTPIARGVWGSRQRGKKNAGMLPASEHTQLG
jgi:hypothetical protein